MDLEKRELTIEKTLEYRYSVGQWVWGPPKTKKGVRTLKLTNTAYKILSQMFEERKVSSKTPDDSTDYKRLSKILGHSSIKITVDTYVHETEQTIEEATAKYSNYLDALFES